MAHIFLTLNIGGMEKVGIDLIDNLDSDLYENHVICLKELGVLGTRFKQRSTNVISLGSNGGFSFSVISQLIDYFRANNIQIVHTNNSAPHFWGGLAAAICGVKARIHTNHGRNFDWPTRRLWLDRFSSLLSSRIVCVSQDSAAKLVKSDKINPNKLSVICNGIDTSYFSPGTSTQGLLPSLGITEDCSVIGSVARFSTDKDQETLIRAFNALLKEGITKIRLVLVGDGDTRAGLEKLVRDLGIQDKVIFTGSRSDILDVLRSLDIYVLPSHTEGLSISLLEAMSTGCRVVASAVGGNVEIIEDHVNGLLVKDSDVQGMAAVLRSLLSSQLGDALSKAARETVLKNYSVQAMADNYQDLYASVYSQ